VAGLTWQEFHTRYELTNQPVVLTDGAAKWPALHKWSMEYLRAAYGQRPVIAGVLVWSVEGIQLWSTGQGRVTVCLIV
jgi:hypothetical protein